MTDLDKYLSLSERFEALRLAADAMLAELDDRPVTGGRLDRSAAMLRSTIVKMAAELHRRGSVHLDPELQRAGVDLFHPSAAGPARDLARLHAPQPDTSA